MTYCRFNNCNHYNPEELEELKETVGIIGTRRSLGKRHGSEAPLRGLSEEERNILICLE